MDMITAFFSVNTIAFTILGYSISWLELVGTIFNLVCVILAARRNIWNWPIGLIGVMLFGVLFYQINLYADVFEQVYYLITGISGWYLWARVGTNKTLTKKCLSPPTVCAATYIGLRALPGRRYSPDGLCRTCTYGYPPCSRNQHHYRFSTPPPP